MLGRHHKRGMRILVLGEHRCGKSSLLYNFFIKYSCGGIVCLPVFTYDNCYIGKDVFDFATHKRHLFCRLKKFASFSGIETKRYINSFDGISFANSAIEQAFLNQLNPIIIDEIGSLEMKGEGLFQMLKKILEDEKLFTILVLRKKLENEFTSMFPGVYSKLYIK